MDLGNGPIYKQGNKKKIAVIKGVDFEKCFVLKKMIFTWLIFRSQSLLIMIVNDIWVNCRLRKKQQQQESHREPTLILVNCKWKLNER